MMLASTATHRGVVNGLLIGVGCVVALGVGETVVRALHLSKTVNSYRFEAHAGLNPLHDLATAEGLAYLGNLSLGLDNPHHPEYRSNATVSVKGVTFSTNEFGYRQHPSQSEVSDTAFRILVVGDSVSFGYLMPSVRTFPALLESQLSKHQPVRVLNAGMHGNDTHGNLYTLQRAMRLFAPQLIIYQFGLNDIGRRSVVDAGGEVAAGGPQSRAPWMKLKRVLRRSALYLSLAERYNYVKLRWGLRTWVFDAWAVTQPPERERHAMQRVYDEVQREGIPMVVTVLPYDWQVFSDRDEAVQIQQRVSELLDDERITFVDMTTVFKAQRSPERLFLDDCHLSRVGHELAADILLEPVTALMNAASTTSW